MLCFVTAMLLLDRRKSEKRGQKGGEKEGREREKERGKKERGETEKYMITNNTYD